MAEYIVVAIASLTHDGSPYLAETHAVAPSVSVKHKPLRYTCHEVE